MSNIKYHVEFKELTVEYFQSIGSKIIFDFSKHPGLNYVFGTNADISNTRNGSGKSALFVDALLFVLFGETSKHINNKYLPNRQTPKGVNTIVTLRLSSDNDIYFLEAGFVRPLSQCLPYFKLYKNEEEITKSSLKETRAFFEKNILKNTYNIFKNSNVLSTCDSQNFFSLAKSQKREFIESIFNLNIFGDMLKKIRADINSLDKEILNLQSTNKQLNEDIIKFEESNRNFEDQKKVRIEEMEGKVTFKTGRNKELLIENEKLVNNINNINLNELEELRSKLKETESTKTKIEHIIRTSNRDISNYNSIINKHKDVLNNVCDECNNKLKDLLNIKQAEDKILSEQQIIEKYEKAIKIIESTYKILQSKIVESNKKKILYDNLIKTKEHNLYVINHLDNDIRDLTNKIKKERESSTPFTSMIAEYKTKLSDTEKTLSNYYLKKKQLDILTHVVSEDGAKKFIIKDLVNILNGRIRTYLNETGASYTCIFDNSFSCEFITETGPCSYENFSAGEKARINIAVLFAFKDMLNSLGNISNSILVLDEFLDSSLDTFGVNALINIIKRIANQTQSIFLISHRECFDSDTFDNIIEVEKKNGLTTIKRDDREGVI